MKEDKDYEKLYRDMMGLPQEELIGPLGEEDIENLLEEAELIELPGNIDEYIAKGVNKGRKILFRKRIRLASTLAAAFACIFFISMIYISPAFAEGVSKIPGLNYIVELVYRDKGLKAAVEQNFVINVNESVEKQGIKITIKDVIIDTSRAEIYYEIVNESQYDSISIEEVKFRDGEGNKLKEYAFGHDGMPIGLTKDGEYVRSLSILFSGDIDAIPEIMKISIELKQQKEFQGGEKGEKIVLEGSWDFSFPIDTERLKDMVHEYTINKKVVVEGQEIIFKKARITPIQTTLYIEYAESNTKKIFSFEDLELVDEDGAVWRTVEGWSGSRGDDNHQTINLESDYFKDPKELYIRGSSIRAMDKDKLTVILDVENEKVIKSPDESFNFTVDEFTEDSLTISYRYKDSKEDDSGGLSFQWDAVDSRGVVYRSTSSSSYGGSTVDNVRVKSGSITLAIDKDFVGPISLELDDYPARINEEFTVRIK
ncbi:DUF4179 domain-containing protein [Alloiococcus sp. CFN-8]|uniref:DUF4179 domain-containing protein n=1 Tax=Alloiococcus sp. CFN-8 TaxID=3416081 RepID=UPI003CF136BF